MQTDETNQLLDKAFDLVEAGQIIEAGALFEQVCQQDTGNAEAWMMRGSIDLELGKLDDAFAELTHAITLDPSMPEAHYFLANVYRSRGDLEQALSSVEQALVLDSGYGEAYMLGGVIYGMLGQLEKAGQYCRKAVELVPAAPDTHLNLGSVLVQQGSFAEACQHFTHAAQLQPGSFTPWLMLGRTYAQLDDIGKSAEAYQNVLNLKPDSDEACYGLGYASYKQGRLEDAVSYLKRAVEINPAYLEAFNSLGVIYQAMGNYHEAVAAFQRVLDINPDHAEALFGKARAFIDISRQPEAVPLLKRALEIRPDYVEANLNLAATLMTFDQPGEAIKYCNKVLELQPDFADAIALMARIELQAGQVEEAYQRLKSNLQSGSQHINVALAYGEVCRSKNCPEEVIDMLEAFLGHDALSVNDRRNLSFSLGKLYDKNKNYDKAFSHFSTGNKLRGKTWDPQENKSQVNDIINVFSKEFFSGAPRAAVVSDKPVFVLGMPRSGTSLVEQILASHPAVFGAGELTDLLRMAHGLPALLATDLVFPHCVTELNQEATDRLAQGYLTHLDELSVNALRVTDKMPGNFSFLGLIELLFPGAHVIHCKRAPLDTCLSCYFQDFAMSQPYSFNLEHLGSFYRDYERLMAHWKETLTIPVLDVNYEDLVGDQESQSRRLVEFTGLDWDESCLQFHETDRFVATSSYDQVKKPIYNSSVKRWEKYREHLGPLFDALQ